MVRKCSIEGCETKSHGEGFCAKHYRAFKAHGDPTVVKQKQLHGASLRERIQNYTEHGEGCWSWTGYRDPNGYGRLRVDGVPKLAHRLSWELYRGTIPEGMHVLHRCDNPPCVKPAHLFLGDHDMNMRDKMAKKRHRYGVSKGEKHGCSKLTEQQVREIRASVGPSRIIGEQYGISGRQVREIRTRTAWAHIP